MALVIALTVSSASAAPPTTICGSGAGAGQCEHPEGGAVDQSTGDYYLVDANNKRIDVFTAPGEFIRAFGWGVLDGAEELQVCTTTCRSGIFGSGAGQIVFGGNIAVDNDPASPSFRDVYVAETARIQKFTPAGEFVLMIGGGVNRTKDEEVGSTEAERNLCTAASGDLCEGGSFGSGHSEFSNPQGAISAAVDGEGDLWAGDDNRLQRFASGGAFISQVELVGAGEVTSLAIDIDATSPSFGDLYLKSSEVEGIQKLEPSGTASETLDATGHPTLVATDPASGDVYLADEPSLLRFGPTGAQLSSFGTGEFTAGSIANAFSFGSTAQKLYVVNEIFELPPPGPLQRAGSLTAKAVHPTSATLNAVLNPEGAETTYHFEYLTEAAYQHNLTESLPAFTGATETTPPGTLPADFEEHEAAAAVNSLAPGTTYRFRLLADNVNGEGTATGTAVGEFTTLPPAEVLEEFSSEVAATSATLNAKIDPLGLATEYRFEYLTEAEFQANGETFAGASLSPIPDALLGSVEEAVAVSQHLQGLQSETTYRYRAFAHNVVGAEVSEAGTLRTQGALASTLLPDNRQWQLVSPPDKHGSSLLPIIGSGVVEAASSGEAITYLGTAPIEDGAAGSAFFVQALSRRGAAGWSSANIVLPHTRATGVSAGHGFEYHAFSEDLSLGLVQPNGAFVPTISPEASEQTPFLHSNFSDTGPGLFCAVSCSRPLVTAAGTGANVPTGTSFGEDAECERANLNSTFCGPTILNANPDLSAALIATTVSLQEGVPPPPPGREGFYEWSAGHLTFVGDGEAAGYEEGDFGRNGISRNGARVFFEGSSEGLEGLLMHDTATGNTVKLGNGTFQAATSDGSEAFFTEGGDLYGCEIVEEAGNPHCDLTDLAPGAEIMQGASIAGISANGSDVYFTADRKLTPDAVEGTCESSPTGVCNLYLSHDGSLRLVAILSAEDSPDWAHRLRGLAIRVSPNGRWLAFMSQRSLTGYDNRDASNGERDEEVFLYDATADDGEGEVICASCNSTGARPHGKEVSELDAEGGKGGLAAGVGVWLDNRWLAANVPGWTPDTQGQSLHQSRYLSDTGRLFFNTSDSLVPTDTNGDEDVYEFEPAGVGTCSSTSPTFTVSSGGCVSLISSGVTAGQSAFLDASEGGADVFFITGGQLTKSDLDTSLDIYDAHECTTGSPCLSEPPPPAPECAGDACQPPTAAPNDATPSSLTFNGAGNAVECPKGKFKKNGKCVKHKAKKEHHKKKGHKKQKRASSNRGGHK